jgi:hypothetical protein
MPTPIAQMSSHRCHRTDVNGQDPCTGYSRPGSGRVLYGHSLVHAPDRPIRPTLFIAQGLYISRRGARSPGCPCPTFRVLLEYKPIAAMTVKPLRWGILATGSISTKFCQVSSQSKCSDVCSCSLSRIFWSTPTAVGFPMWPTSLQLSALDPSILPRDLSTGSRRPLRRNHGAGGSSRASWTGARRTACTKRSMRMR